MSSEPAEYIATVNAGISAHRSDLSANDLLRLRALDPSQVQEWAAARMEEYARRIAALKTVYNSAAPINRELPPEVLMEVFSQLPAVGSSESHPSQQPLKVLGVCRYWRSLLFRTPAIWASVLAGRRTFGSADQDSEVTSMNLLLAFTRSRPLSLQFYRPHASIVTTLLPHAYRLSSLTLALDGSDLAVKALNDLLNADMPLLEDFSISHEPAAPRMSPKPIVLTPERLPRLRRLRYPILLVELNADGPLQLPSLTVFACECTQCMMAMRPQLSTWLATLTQCRFVRCLVLEGAIMTEESTDTRRIIEFPHLCTLTVSGARRFTSQLLPRLSPPPTCPIHVSHTDAESWGDSPWFPDMLPANLDAFRPVAAANRIHFEHVGNVFHLKTFIDDINLMHLEDPNFERLSVAGGLRALAVMLPPCSVDAITALAVDTTSSRYWSEHQVRDLKDAQWKLLSSLPHLARLDLMGDNETEVMLTLLSRMCGSVGTQNLICPNLEELHIRWNHYHDHEHSLLRGRLHYKQADSGSFTALCDRVLDVLERRKVHAAPKLKALSIVVHGVAQSPMPREEWDAVMDRERLRLEIESMWFGNGGQVVSLALSE